MLLLKFSVSGYLAPLWLSHLIQYSLLNKHEKVPNFFWIEKINNWAKSNRENVIHERQENFAKIANFSHFLAFFEDFAFLCQNSAYIGILPSKIGFALSSLCLFYWNGQGWAGDLKFDAPTASRMDAYVELQDQWNGPYFFS